MYYFVPKVNRFQPLVVDLRLSVGFYILSAIFKAKLQKKLCAALSEDYNFKILNQHNIWIISIEKILNCDKRLIF